MTVDPRPRKAYHKFILVWLHQYIPEVGAYKYFKFRGNTLLFYPYRKVIP